MAFPGETWFGFFVHKLLKDYADMRFGSGDVATDAAALSTDLAKEIEGS